jgi:hypothetical protein
MLVGAGAKGSEQEIIEVAELLGSGVAKAFGRNIFRESRL